MTVSIEELREQDIRFDNLNDMDRNDDFAIELSITDTNRTRPFHLWVNGELRHTFTTLASLNRRAMQLIDEHNLERALEV